LRKICCTGLANSLASRISRRSGDEKVTWSLDKYIRTPSTYFTGVRVMADRAMQIPDLPSSGLRQVVVRITSRQTTGTIPVAGKRGNRQLEPTSEATPKVKSQDCTEYLVLQKLMWGGEEDEWRIWSHTTPTTLEDLDSPYFATGLTLSERLSMMRETMEKK
jgi:protein MBA1